MNDNFKHIVMVIEESKDLEFMSIDEFMGSLIIYEQRKNKKKQDTIKQVLLSKLSLKDEKEDSKSDENPSD